MWAEVQTLVLRPVLKADAIVNQHVMSCCMQPYMPSFNMAWVMCSTDLKASGMCWQSPQHTLPLFSATVQHSSSMPVQGQGSAEASEEVRLLLLQLLDVILQQAGTAVAAYASEVWSVLSAGLSDPYHEAAEQACRTVQQLAGEAMVVRFDLSAVKV
jgi:hypothetical protein